MIGTSTLRGQADAGWATTTEESPRRHCPSSSRRARPKLKRRQRWTTSTSLNPTVGTAVQVLFAARSEFGTVTARSVSGVAVTCVDNVVLLDVQPGRLRALSAGAFALCAWMTSLSTSCFRGILRAVRRVQTVSRGDASADVDMGSVVNCIFGGTRRGRHGS